MAARLILAATLTLALLASFDRPRAAPMDRLPGLVRWARGWGCADKTTSAASRAAFQTLHRLFPRSDWARRTKYWY